MVLLQQRPRPQIPKARRIPQARRYSHGNGGAARPEASRRHFLRNNCPVASTRQEAQARNWLPPQALFLGKTLGARVQQLNKAVLVRDYVLQMPLLLRTGIAE